MEKQKGGPAPNIRDSPQFAGCANEAVTKLSVEFELWDKPSSSRVAAGCESPLDKKLLHAADQAAKRAKRNRSALVRDALREHLRRLELRASEERDRQGYSRQSQADAEARGWESEATWPQD